MKTRRLATALDRGSVDESSDQAAGLVSRMIVSSDGDCSAAVDHDNRRRGQPMALCTMFGKASLAAT